MRRPAAAAVVLAVWILAGLPGAVAQADPAPTAPPGSAAAGGCPEAVRPAPPVDASEAPRPGQPSPPPLPVPDPPVGGPALATCATVAPQGAAPPPAVGSTSYVLADLDSGEVLAARAPHARLRPASLMKTLTGLLVARNLPPDQVLTATPQDAAQEGTRVGVGPGGRYTVRQLLDVMLMASGNDVAHMLAVRLTGSVPGTVAQMNHTAAGLGAHDTRAATPSGLDGPGMQTSAYDLASIFRVGMREPGFATAVGTQTTPFPGYGTQPGYVVANDNKLWGRYPGFLGGKTGFTNDARHTYVGSAQRGGRRLVVVLMHGEQPMVEQASALLDYGFAMRSGLSVGRLTDGPDSATTVDPEIATNPAALDGVDPATSGATARWQTPAIVGVIVVVALLAAAVRLRNQD